MAIINGTTGNDTLVGTELDDTLVGGAGDDTMTGGAGADTFVLEFGEEVIAGGSLDFADWLADNGFDPVADGTLTSAEFQALYLSYLEAVVTAFAIGSDADADGAIEVSLDGTSGTPVIEGLTPEEAAALFTDVQTVDVVSGGGTDTISFANAFAEEDTTVFTGPGSDVITDFNAAEGDQLQVTGVTADDVPDFLVRVADVDGDGTLDTEFTLETDDTWSLQLLGSAVFDVATDVSGAPGTGEEITGTDGNDTLSGGDGDDLILGLAGDDVLDGMAGADEIEGGEGDDTMTGGEGADQFNFSFGGETVDGATLSFAQWRADHGLAPLEDGVTTQGDFASSYAHFLQDVAREFALGFDADLDGQVEIGLRQNDPNPTIEGLSEGDVDLIYGDRIALEVKTGNTTHTRYYTDTFTIEDREIFTGSGQDTVTDFNPAEGDRLIVDGAEANLSDFLLRTADVDADGTLDTQFLLTTDPNWSVTLLGYSQFSVEDVVVV